MFWLKKAVAFWLMPLPAGLALIFIGTGLWWRQRRVRTGRTLVVLGLALLTLASNRQVGLRLLKPLEDRYPSIPELPAHDPLPPRLAACRYIVVLGGGHADAAALPATSRLSPYALARIVEAVRLARRLPDARIITSGPGLEGRPSHAATLEAAAVDLGIDARRFQLIDTARDTAEEARAVRHIVGNEPFALVTSAWHMPRAMALMQGAGLQPLPCPADFLSRTNDEFTWSDWGWGLDGLERSTWACHEWIGLLWTRLNGNFRHQ